MESSPIGANLKKVQENINAAVAKSEKTNRAILVAASKTKYPEELQEAYNAGQRHFGENYVDEIIMKHEKLPQDIQWHLIGHLQSNKVNKVIVPNLYMIETVDSIKLATKIQTYCKKIERKLKVLIQINISDEDSKSGIKSNEDIFELVEYLLNECENLEFSGIMTIGYAGNMEDFKKMYEFKQLICDKYSLDKEKFELSMGMSSDYEQAISDGATMVRVGSTIFGARQYKRKNSEGKLEFVDPKQVQAEKVEEPKKEEEKKEE